MRQKVKLPRVADTVDEVVVIEWVAAVGDEIGVGDGLVSVETDKTTMEIPSPVAGVLVEQLVAVQDEIETGTAIAVIEGR
jgi:pyruvate/2-oxoglutarate dehydrogenase complex dihydrolipoamide acyltransferase (E2) component